MPVKRSIAVHEQDLRRWSQCGLFALAAALSTELVEFAQAQSLPSSRKITVGSNDWFNASAWSHGVPNAPGAEAQLQLAVGTSQVVLGSPVTLARLVIEGSGTTTLQGAGPLSFVENGAGELLLQVASVGVTANINLPVVLDPDTPLVVEPIGGVIQINGPISSSGDILKRGTGELGLGGANPVPGAQADNQRHDLA